MRTTLTLDADVMAKLKEESRKTGQPFKEIVNTFLRLGFHAKQAPKTPKHFVVKAHSMGTKPGLNYDNIGELLEQSEGPLHP